MTTNLISSRLALYLWGMVIATLAFCGGQYLNMGHKKGDSKEKYLLYGFGCFFFGLALMRIFFHLAGYQLEGEYINHNFYGSYENTNDIYKLFIRGGYFSGILGFTLLIFSAEKRMKNTRYLLSILNVGFLTSILFLLYDIAKLICYIAVMFDILVLLIILFAFTRKSRLEFQAVSLSIIVGSLLMIAGHILDTSVIKETTPVPLIISPLFYIFGSIITIMPTFITPDLFTRTTLYWLVFGISLISLFLISSLFIMSTGISTIFTQILLVGLITVTVVIIYSIVRMMRKMGEGSITKGEDQDEGFFKIFTKPQRITEEEVTYHREKKICLICKGKTQRKVYICPDCNAIYCENCSNALIKMENACWACYAPIDPSLPVNIETTEINVKKETAYKDITKSHKLEGK
ncbi:MAG: hypothetical protein ACFFCS_05380 [Candidatus Hodarchaeota archaeon]